MTDPDEGLKKPTAEEFLRKRRGKNWAAPTLGMMGWRSSIKPPPACGMNTMP